MCLLTQLSLILYTDRPENGTIYAFSDFMVFKLPFEIDIRCTLSIVVYVINYRFLLNGCVNLASFFSPQISCFSKQLLLFSGNYERLTI